MDTNIELSAEELELIKLKRETEAAEKEAADCKKREDDLTKITEAKKRFEKLIAQENTISAIEKKMANELVAINPELFALKSTPMKLRGDASNYIGGDDPAKREEILWEDYYAYTSYKVEIIAGHAKGNFVRIKEHKTYGRGTWGNSTSHGWKYYMSNSVNNYREYYVKNPTKIANKVSEYNLVKHREATEKQRKLNIDNQALDMVKDRFAGKDVQITVENGKYSKTIIVKNAKITLAFNYTQGTDGAVTLQKRISSINDVALMERIIAEAI
jgi:hypothetical protein